MNIKPRGNRRRSSPILPIRHNIPQDYAVSAGCTSNTLRRGLGSSARITSTPIQHLFLRLPLLCRLCEFLFFPSGFSDLACRWKGEGGGNLTTGLESHQRARNQRSCTILGEVNILMKTQYKSTFDIVFVHNSAKNSSFLRSVSCCVCTIARRFIRATARA